MTRVYLKSLHMGLVQLSEYVRWQEWSREIGRHPSKASKSLAELEA